MRKTFLFLLALAALAVPAIAQPTQWFVRKDGGSRYTVENRQQGQCDGKADVSYASTGGTGINQHCAFNDVRFLWTDGQYTNATTGVFPAWGWIGKGSDIYIIRDGPWRVGQNGPNNGDSFGLNGDPFSAGAPPPPNGTTGAHTQILGEGFANCTTQTQLFGGYGVSYIFNLGGAQNIDIRCIELTRHSQCIKYGAPAVPSNCSTSFPLDDYAQNGIITGTSTHDLLLQDMNIHGFTSRGIIGAIGGTVTANNVRIAYNGAAGWDFDDGAATPSVNGLLVADNLVIEWNGCNQAYPGTGAVSCYSQSTGGYGDGIGTPAGTCISTQVTNSTFRYNTQDGYDWLHNDTGTCPSSVTHSQSYGNNGSQFKWGPANNPMTFTNNRAVSGCMRLSAPMNGQISTYNANLADFCRASDTIVPSLGNNGNATIDHNTIISYAPTIFDVECGPAGCANSTLTMSNNIILGYDNPATYPLGGRAGGPGALYFSATPTNVIRTNNVVFGTRAFVPVTTEQVVDPAFVGEPKSFTQESDLDVFSAGAVLPAGSALNGLGASGVAVSTPPPPPPQPTAITSADGIVTATPGESALSVSDLGSNTRTVSHVSFQVHTGGVASSGQLLATTTFLKTTFPIGSCIVVQNGSASLGLGWLVDPVVNSIAISLPAGATLPANMTVVIHIDCYPFTN